jgi:hypothetical protein
LTTVKDWANTIGKVDMDAIARILTESNALLEDLMANEPPPVPRPWWVRMRMNLGDWLILQGIRLGGDYDY